MRRFRTDTARRSFGFTLFHVAVNLGSACAPLLGAWVQSRGGWSVCPVRQGMEWRSVPWCFSPDGGCSVTRQTFRTQTPNPPAQNLPRRWLLPHSFCCRSQSTERSTHRAQTRCSAGARFCTTRRDGMDDSSDSVCTLPPSVVLLGPSSVCTAKGLCRAWSNAQRCWPDWAGTRDLWRPFLVMMASVRAE